MPLIDLEGLVDFGNADDDSSDSEDEDLEEHQQVILVGRTIHGAALTMF